MLPTIWDTIPATGDSRECFGDEVAMLVAKALETGLKSLQKKK